MDNAYYCPVCGRSASNITNFGFDGRSITCEVCGEYDIAGRACLRFDGADTELRQNALATAKRFAHNGRRPLIDRKCV
jgi:hypothetical protein